MSSINQKKLFFIIGVGRSGTSILQELMNTFLGFCNAKESRIYNEKIFSLWTPVRKSHDFSLLEEFIQKNWTSEYFVEKTPDSILCLPELSKQYPQANYIFLERDPLDIVLSQLNMFQGSKDISERYYHIENSIMDHSDLLLTREQYYAKMILKQVFCQIEFKNKFQKMITIRYEDLKKSFHLQITLLEKKFEIKANMDEATNTFRKTSYSSKNNKYLIKTLEDTQAKNMIQTARRLWGYLT